MHTLTRRQSIGDVLHRSAARSPAKSAIICGGVCWTYAQFDGIARHDVLAHCSATLASFKSP